VCVGADVLLLPVCCSSELPTLMVSFCRCTGSARRSTRWWRRILKASFHVRPWELLRPTAIVQFLPLSRLSSNHSPSITSAGTGGTLDAGLPSVHVIGAACLWAKGLDILLVRSPS